MNFNYHLKKSFCTILNGFFILDYSGSMEQMLDNKPKIDILKNQFSSYTQTLPPTTFSLLTIFGLHPELACNDIKVHQGSIKQIESIVQREIPGEFGQTPLANSILNLKRYRHKKEVWTSPSIILTDGGDSCGGDPCAALKELDQYLDLNNKIELKIIGFDLKAQKERLTCFSNLKGKLDNFNIELLTPDNIGALNDTMEKISQNSPIAPGMASVYISGAPDHATFIIENPKNKVSWTGSFKQTITPIPQTIRLNQSRQTKSIKISPIAGAEIQLFYSDFFQDKNSYVTLLCENLKIIATPGRQTRLMHEKVDELELCNDSTTRHKLPFGDWTFTTTSPWWVKDHLKAEISLSPSQRVDLTATKLFENMLEWIPLNSMTTAKVVEIDGTKILIAPGTARIPALKGAQAKWLTK